MLVRFDDKPSSGNQNALVKTRQRPAGFARSQLHGKALTQFVQASRKRYREQLSRWTAPFVAADADCVGRGKAKVRRQWALERIAMPIGPDVLVFISATRALIQSLPHHPLSDEERAELECCLRELTALLPRDEKRQAA